MELSVDLWLKRTAYRPLVHVVYEPDKTDGKLLEEYKTRLVDNGAEVVTVEAPNGVACR